MKSKLFFLFLFLFSQNFFAQKKDKSELLYDQGNIAFANKDYKTADSLFGLSLQLKAHPDTYFNKAMCLKKLNNFEGYCVNLGGAMNMGDNEAKKLYNTQCIRTDTLKGREMIADTIIKSIKLVTNYLYNGNVEYEKYDLDTNLLSSFYILKNDTVYNYHKAINFTEPPSSDSSIMHMIKKTRFADLVREKTLTGKITLSVIYDKKGRIESIKTISSTTGLISENELINELYKLPQQSVATLEGKKVKYSNVISILYAKKLIYVWANETPKKLRPKGIFLDQKLSLKEEEVMPEFTGGVIEMMKFIQKNIQYPQMAKEAGLTGKCFLKFVIDKDGSVNNVAIMRGVPGCIECDIEAMRVVYSMPKWKPGMQKGKPVSVFFNLPINFNLR